MYFKLKTSNTDDTDGSINPAKLCFGNNGEQEWWIAGSQYEDSLTLFAASSLATNQKFAPDDTGDNDATAIKTYSDIWGCTYTDNSTPTVVNANHYGGSPKRQVKESVRFMFMLEMGMPRTLKLR